MIPLTINGTEHRVDTPADTPLLWAIQDFIGFPGKRLHRLPFDKDFTA